MKCSIVMSTHDRPELLSRTLSSIRCQTPPFEFECIVVDDGSPRRSAAAVRTIVRENSFGYFRIDRPAEYRNPGPARNLGYRIANGEIVICQSDDVIHTRPGTIERLVAAVRNDNFAIATVWNGEIGGNLYTGPDKPSPLFFLGAIQRRHIYAIGGNEEEFDEPGYDDNFFADCLMNGLGLKPDYLADVVGIHQDHERPRLVQRYRRMKAVYERKVAYAHAIGKWEASGGPWPMDVRTV